MGMLGIIALPVVLGTAAVILVNQPMPRMWVNARIMEAGVWLFAAPGALTIRESQRIRQACTCIGPTWQRRFLRLWRFDWRCAESHSSRERRASRSPRMCDTSPTNL